MSGLVSGFDGGARCLDAARREAARGADEALGVLRLGEGHVEPLAAPLHLDHVARDPVPRDRLLERVGLRVRVRVGVRVRV